MYNKETESHLRFDGDILTDKWYDIMGQVFLMIFNDLYISW